MKLTLDNSLVHMDYSQQANAPYDDGSLNGIHVCSRSLHPGSTFGVASLMGTFGSRVYVPPFPLARVTSQPSMQNLGSSFNMPTDAHPRRSSTSQSSIATDPILMGDGQIKGLEKLRREIYNPGIQRVNLYYRNYDDFKAKSQEEQSNNDGQRCSVCLDDFEPREMVTLTPCNHMFHENCIVPWVKSHGQCPTCRFVIIDRNKERVGSQSSDNNELVNDPFARDLVSFIRDMEGRG
ncbi:uncharacterized protein [Rutidosis leptorrhynchoides]|uniref:uncharacterized protein n=1 Tax=Rutidosis leptorrhynchoides TaxID=125765 RepID=UPI003A9A25B4